MNYIAPIYISRPWRRISYTPCRGISRPWCFTKLVRVTRNISSTKCEIFRLWFCYELHCELFCINYNTTCSVHVFHWHSVNYIEPQNISSYKRNISSLVYLSYKLHLVHDVSRNNSRSISSMVSWINYIVSWNISSVILYTNYIVLRNISSVYKL